MACPEENHASTSINHAKTQQLSYFVNYIQRHLLF